MYKHVHITRYVLEHTWKTCPAVGTCALKLTLA